MSGLFMRQVIDSLMPKGEFWQPAPGSDLDNFLDGFAENEEAVLHAIETLGTLRDPWNIPLELLSDLERDFGVKSETGQNEMFRREYLASMMFKTNSIPSDRKLQLALNLAGFGTSGGYGLRVYRNESPAADPTILIDDVPGRYYLVNGDVWVASPVYPQTRSLEDEKLTVAQEPPSKSSAGYYDSYGEYSSPYTAPAERYWPMVFFVGGLVSRKDDGSISNITPITIPLDRRQELHRIVMRCKSWGSWAGMCVEYEP
ncbi:hypothetical protein FACS1894110_10020 [Spirochaetia bacterium]|nr:hypothetical protein FACS1894110_10020 [Spirochaetia bacterium]